MEQNVAVMSNQLPVQFVETLDRYPTNGDIECRYIFNNYKVQEGDRIAIFQMGWKSLRNYVLFEWAMDLKADVSSVIFSRYDLPNNPAESDELYQFCYISGENVVQGISTPFQIYAFNSPPRAPSTASSYEHKKCTHLKQLLTEKDEEILKLKEENAILKESLKAIVEQRSTQKHKCHSEDIDHLKELTSKLKNAILGQQKDIDSMKIEMRRERTMNKNLMLDKIIAEKKLEVICSQSDKSSNSSSQRLPKFDLGSLQSIPPFPLDNYK